MKTPLGYIGYKYDSCFPSCAKLKINLAEKNFTINRGDSIQLRCRYSVPDNYKKFIANNPYPPDTTVIGVFNGKGFVMDIPTSLRLSGMNDQIEDTIKVVPPLAKGKYLLRFALHVGNYYPAHTSDNIHLEIK
jgi:hypothetical protein